MGTVLMSEAPLSIELFFERSVGFLLMMMMMVSHMRREKEI